jgi:hypothetical protein
MRILSKFWRKEKNGRYYKLYLYKDMLGWWVITKAWGSRFSKTGGSSNHAFSKYDEAKNYIDEVIKRRALRGYTLMS